MSATLPLTARAPRLVRVEMSKRARGGRVFADALRNAFGQTIVAPYAVRRRPLALTPGATFGRAGSGCRPRGRHDS